MQTKPAFFVVLFSLLALGCTAFGQPADPKVAPTEAKTEDKKPEDKKPGETKPEEKPEPKPTLTPAEKFQATQAKWNEIDNRLTAIAGKYNAVDDEERKVLKAEYTKLVADSQAVLIELRKAAETAFVAEPNKDPNVTRTLIGMVAFNNRRDEHEQAFELGKTMIEAKCEEPVLYALAGTAAYRMDDFDTAEKYLTVADKAGRLDPEQKAYLTSIPEMKKAWAKELEVREKEAKANDLPRVKIETNRGVIVIELFENEAPGAVGNFISLVEKKFYDNLTFHRVLPNFMAQGGDPSGNGTGGPGYSIYCECEKPEARMHFRGSLSMAHAGKDTGGSQFFLTFLPTTQLNGRHTVFGRVIEGFDVLAKIQRRDPQALNPPQPDKIVKAEVVRKRDHSYQPTPVK